MAAGLGFKTFNTGEVLTSADVNGYLMQGVLVFASEAARNAAITSPQEGQFAYTKDNNSLWYYTGSAWAASGATGDIEGVTAGTGISGGGTSGTVTITNSMATAIDAKGDLVPGTGADTFSRLAVGANGTVLTADSAEATGLKWAAPSAGTWTQAATGSMSGATVTVSSLSGKEYYVFWLAYSHNSGSEAHIQLQLNGDTGSNYYDFSGAAVSALLPLGNITVAGAATRSGGCHIGMADTAMEYKPVTSINATSGTIGGQNAGWYDSSSAITSMTFRLSSGSFDAGTYYVWSKS